MGHTRTALPLLLAFALGASTFAVPAVPALAQDSGGQAFEGLIRIGYRSVDVGGAERKFREDVNQEDGPILFDLDLDFFPDGEGKGFADHVEVDLDEIGSEAFESFHLGIEKYGRYDFEFDRRESAYFYRDFLEFTDPAHLDPRTLDFRRVRDTANLEIDLSPAAKLRFGFEQYTKRGEGTVSLDISRDEFELDQVIDEELQTSTVGFSYAWDRVTLVLEERLRDYANVVELFLPGFSEGVEPGPATLDFFFLDQPYDYRSNEHSVKVLARPIERLDLRFSADLHDLELNLDAGERSRGLAFNGAPLATDSTGRGDISRDVALYDVEATYLVSDRWAILGEVRRTDLDQGGDFVFGGVPRRGDWDIETTTFRAGLQFFVNDDLSVSGGALVESRDVVFDWAEGDAEAAREAVTTDSDGYFALVSWRPEPGLELGGEVDVNSIDDPFTLISPTDRIRYRARARYRWANGLSLAGNYQVKDYENDASGWTTDSTTATVRLGWSADGLSASVGYSLVDVEREIAQRVTGGARTVLFPIFYQVDAETLDGQLRWTANDRLTLGGSANLYQNDGSFGIDYTDYRAYVEVGFLDGYVGGIALRTLDYDETGFDLDDYDADILELSLGYRW